MIFNRKTVEEEGPASTAAQEYSELRRAMVREQIRDRGIRARNVLDAMLAVPRHLFVPEEFRAAAYADQPLPIGEGQTISQPFMVAAMTVALELTGTERVLEIGTGSGYQAAILSLLAQELHTVERSTTLAQRAAERLTHLGYANVHVHAADGTLGWAEAAPYEGIIVTAAAPRVPPPLVEQLADGGRLVIPVGDEYQQELLLVRKAGEQTTSQVLHYCRFVPLVGLHGWHEPIL
jgi:protein-L-isoaspartate(D-aspartate) O-methyltransferase